MKVYFLLSFLLSFVIPACQCGILCKLFHLLQHKSPSQLQSLLPNMFKYCNLRKGQVVRRVDYDSVMRSLESVMTEGREFWPADYGTYAPLFIRLAWHSAGSYRTSDGRGGADGARQRFEPERSWTDNTNLDKARRLLWPVKEKYSEALSWADLIILAGNAAIKSMGGNILGFCGGRVDAADGSESVQLGPSEEQEAIMSCPVQGDCQRPLGTSTIGLIYVNPEGHLGVPDPARSAVQIREVFSRMGMNDTETVALIGGGHTTGKCHGACPAGAGKSPAEDPLNPWPGLCGSGPGKGKGNNTFTSGFELPFTSKPTDWDNEYFKNLINYRWSKFRGPGGHFQWAPSHVQGKKTPKAATAHDPNKTESIGLLTTDVALIHDEKYRNIVKRFASDQTDFDHQFAHAWYKLTTRDMGPRRRCVNKDAPPEQHWQYPLPQRTSPVPDFQAVKRIVVSILQEDESHLGLLARLAWQCASTFRQTNYQGGCNGARIRFSPGKDWSVNKNLQAGLDLLEPVRETFGPSLSMSDLIILAGTTALELAGGLSIPFCSVGRADLDRPDDGWKHLKPRVSGGQNETVALLKDYISVMGLTVRQFTALMGAGYSIGHSGDCEGLFCQRNVFSETGTKPSQVLSNIFFRELLREEWEPVRRQGRDMFQAVGGGALMYEVDLHFKTDPELLALSHQFAGDNKLFLSEVSRAWIALVNADMFDGPSGNLCD